MTTIRQLIEHLDVTGDYHQFAQSAEQFGDDLEQMWAGSENGADLLWLAAVVGVDPQRIIAIACELLEEVFEQIEMAGQETAQVLEAVSAWQRGERSADEVDRSRWEAYDLIAHRGNRSPLPPDAEDVADAAVWLTYLIRDFPPHLPPDLAESNDVPWSGSAGEVVTCLARALAHYQSLDNGSPDRHQQAYDHALHRFAMTIRERIPGAEVQAAAQLSGLLPLS